MSESLLIEGYANENASQQVIKFVVVGLLALGVVFRFANLDRKIYGYDETITLMRIAGLTQREVAAQLYTNREIGIDDIQKFQRPNSDKNLIYTIRSLATDVPQHSPLYFVMARLWADWFGNSPAASKSLPALLSLFALPCVYWLCRELFGWSLSGWIAMGLLAISPFQVLYAHEARPYSLLLVSTLLSSGALLRAVRIQSIQSWMFYSVTVIFGLYGQLLSVLVVIGHSIYVLARERFCIGRLFICHAVAVIAGLVAFLPWLINVVNNSAAVDASMKWTRVRLPLSLMVKAWVGDFSRVFYDSGRIDHQLSLEKYFSDFELVFLVAFGLAVATLAAYSLWFLWRNTEKRVWLFIFSLIGATSVPLLMLDLIFARRVSTNGRYLIAAYLGVQLALSFLLAAKIGGPGNDRQRKVWQQIGALLVLGGIGSCVAISRAEVWPTQSHVYHNPSVARLINRSIQPLVVSDENPAMVIFSLSYLLRPETRFLFVENTAVEISKVGTDIFLFRPSVGMRKALEKNFKVETLHERGGLWTLKRREERRR